MITDTKSLILHLIGKYAQARTAERTTADPAIARRWNSDASKAWDEINVELNKLLGGGA